MKTGATLHYKGSAVHRIKSDKYVIGGDLKRGDGTHSECAFGTGTGKFPDENHILRHTGPGVLGMVNVGTDTNGSQFYLTTAETGWMDGKSVVVGAVVDRESLECLFTVERLGTEWGGTKRKVFCSDSGQRGKGGKK